MLVRRTILSGILLLVVSLPLMAEPPKYAFTLRKADDAITVKERDRRTVFVITSKSGIGGGTIKLTAGDWPSDVTLRFEYKDGLGNGFKMLETFSLTTDRLLVSGSHKQSGSLPFLLPDSAGEYVENQPAAGHLRVTIAPNAGALEVTLPAHLFVGSRQVTLVWIDAYRN